MEYENEDINESIKRGVYITLGRIKADMMKIHKKGMTVNFLSILEILEKMEVELNKDKGE